MQGFYKKYLIQMTDVVKRVTLERVKELESEIEKNQSQQTDIDISTEFETLYQSVICTLIFGSDIKDVEVEIIQ